jgi:hypothetical protein
VTNAIPLGCSLLVPVHTANTAILAGVHFLTDSYCTANCVQTLKELIRVIVKADHHGCGEENKAACEDGEEASNDELSLVGGIGRGIAVDPDGPTVIVADSGNSRIQIFENPRVSVLANTNPNPDPVPDPVPYPHPHPYPHPKL